MISGADKTKAPDNRVPSDTCIAQNIMATKKGNTPAPTTPETPAPAQAPTPAEQAAAAPVVAAMVEVATKKKHLPPEDEALLAQIIKNQEDLGVIDPSRAPIIRRATHIGLVQLVKEMEARAK